MKAPPCLNCGKPLRRFRYRDHEGHRGLDGADGTPREWGDYGDNAVCGLSCGYKLALAILRGKDPVVWQRMREAARAGGK